MRNYLIAGLLLLAVFSANTLALGQEQEKAGFNDRMIASTVKLMAKTYVLTTDLEKLKRKHVAQISRMDDETFYQQYANTLGVIADSPQLTAAFGFSQPIERGQVVEKIKRMDKKTLCAMIDSVPDGVIAARFKRFMGRRMDEMRGMDMGKKVQYAWNSLVGRIEH